MNLEHSLCLTLNLEGLRRSFPAHMESSALEGEHKVRPYKTTQMS
jgi:hypothetical protein